MAYEWHTSGICMAYWDCTSGQERVLCRRCDMPVRAMLSKTANHVCGEERGDCVCMVLSMHGMPVRTMLRITASHTPRVNGMKGCLILVSRLLSTWVRVRVRVGVGVGVRIRG